MKAERALGSITGLIVRCLDPEAVWLFGSVAQGRARPDSDIDLLVIGRFTGPRAARGAELLGLLEQYALPVDLHLLTRGEFEEEAGRPFSLAGTIRRYGVPLYRRTGEGG
jgi:predicted nucleotidyltransferase